MNFSLSLHKLTSILKALYRWNTKYISAQPWMPNHRVTSFPFPFPEALSFYQAHFLEMLGVSLRNLSLITTSKHVRLCSIYSRKTSVRKSSDDFLTLWSWASTSSRTRSMLCRFSLSIRHSKVISRGTFLASRARSVRSFSCCNKAISASVSSRHLFKSFFQLSMSCILFSSFVLLSCWVQRVWLSVSFLRKRLSCRTRCEESLCRSAFVLIIVFEVCQSDTAKRGGSLGSVKAILCSFTDKLSKEDVDWMSLHSNHSALYSWRCLFP